MTIFIEFKDGLYYWTLKDETGVTNDWATSLGGVFEQIIENRTKVEMKSLKESIPISID